MTMTPEHLGTDFADTPPAVAENQTVPAPGTESPAEQTLLETDDGVSRIGLSSSLKYPNVGVTHVAPADMHRSYLRREKAIRRAKVRSGIATAVLTALYITGYFFAADKYVTPAVWGLSSVSVKDVGANNYLADGSGAVITTFGGMGQNASSKLVAEPIAPALLGTRSNTKLLAVDEGSHLQIENTVDAVLQAYEESPADHAIFYGASTGFKTALYVAAGYRKAHPDARITVIGSSGVWDQYSAFQLRDNDGLVEFGQILQKAKQSGDPTLKSILDLASEDTRHKYLRADGTVDDAALRQELGRIGRDVWTRDGTPNSLRIDQLGIIVDDSAESNLRAIATDDPAVAQTVNVVYLESVKKNDNGAIVLNDRVVDERYVINNLRTLCAELGVTLSVYPVYSWHAGEGDYADTPGGYNDVIPQVLTDIDEAYKLRQQKYRADFIAQVVLQGEAALGPYTGVPASPSLQPN